MTLKEYCEHYKAPEGDFASYAVWPRDVDRIMKWMKENKVSWEGMRLGKTVWGLFGKPGDEIRCNILFLDPDKRKLNWWCDTGMESPEKLDAALRGQWVGRYHGQGPDIMLHPSVFDPPKLAPPFELDF